MTATEPSPGVAALVAVLPDQASNAIGTTLHRAWVRATEVSLPGELDFNGTPSGPYADLFFGYFPGGYTTIELDPTQTAVRDVLGSGWWTSFSEALVTQAVYNTATSIQGQVRIGAVEADVANGLPSLRSTALTSYCRVFDAAYQPQLGAATSGVTAAWQAYLDVLTSPTWVNAKLAAYSDGQWTNADWELFHHAVKLLALGAAPADVTAALAQLQSMGLPLPATVNASTWQAYSQYAPDPLLQWSDLSADGHDGMVQSSRGADMYWDTNQGVAGWFVDTGRYYQAPSGSCFTPTTRVLLPDGTDRALSDVAPGDEVWTPDGGRRVRVVAEAQRVGRSTYRLGGHGFAFSDSHPFVDGRDRSRSLAIHVPRAAAFAGGLAAYGLSRLDGDAVIAVVGRDGEVGALPVGGVVELPADDDAGVLLDLILEPSETGFPSFAVGDGGDRPFVLARSEVVRFEQHPDGTHVGLAVLIGSLDTTATALERLRPDDAPTVNRAVRHLSDRLVADARRAAAAPATPAAPAPAPQDGAPWPPPSPLTRRQPIHAELDGLLDAFHDDDGFDWRLSALQEALVANLLLPLDHAVRGGWRPVEADPSRAAHVAVTVHELVGDTHHPLTGQWTLELLADGAVVGRTSLPTVVAGSADATDVRRRIGWTVPAAASCAGTSLRRTTLELRLSAPDGTAWRGRTVLSGELPSGHRHFAVTLRAAGAKSGDAEVTAWLDVQLLCAELAQSHPVTAPRRWDAAARAAYADRLGPALAASFSELFPRALTDVGRSGPPQSGTG